MIFEHLWGVSQTINFPLYLADGTALTTAATFAAGDVKIIKDEGTPGNTSNLPTHEGNGIYSLVLTATEMQCTRAAIVVDDQTATELWLSRGFVSVLDGDYQGAIWYDTGASNTGTTLGTHGIPSNPVNTIAAAITLAGSSNLRRIHILDGSTFTPASTVTGVEFVGIGDQATCALNSQVYIFCRFVNVNVQGITSGDLFCSDSQIATTVSNLEAWNCELLGTVTITGSAKCYDCHSVNPASGLGAVFDFAANNTTGVFRRYSGAIKLTNMDSTNNVDIEGTGHVEIDATCTGGTVTIRGNLSYTDNSSGSVTIVTTAAGVNLTQISGSTANLDKLADYLAVTERVAVTGASTSTIIVAGGLTSALDGAYVDRVVVFTSGTLSGEETVITDYVGSTKTLTVDQLTGSPSINDTFLVLV